MEKRIISLPTNEKKIYRQILVFMNFMFNLTPQEQDVLSEIIRLDNEYEALPPEKRGKFILSTDMRKEMCTNLKLKDTHFNVIFNKLKKRTILKDQLLINENNIIHPLLKFKPDSEGFRIEVNFINTVLSSIETTKEISSIIPSSESEDVIDNTERKLATPSNEAEVVEEESDDFELI